MSQFKNYILLVVFIVICVESFSKSVDSLIFNNEYEKRVFTDFGNNKKVDPLDILISIDYTSKSELFKVKLIDFYATLERGGFKELNKKKQIKDIYKKVHSTFLRKYSEEVVFSDIFNNGNYNCVTATSLYALVLEHYNIDFQIKKTPVHVYLIADPKGEQTAIETTLPNKGLVVYDDRLKKGFVEYLKENKLVSENEFRTMTIDELFEKNYTKAASINLIELTALQYYNKGITQYQSEKFEDAAKSFDKAEQLYSENTIKFMKSNSLVSLLSEQNRTKKYNGVTLAKYMNTNKKSSITIEYTNEYFKAVSREFVINHPNINLYNSYYRDFTFNLSDSIDIKEFSQTYNDLLGYYYYTNNDFINAIKYYGNSFKLNPENIQTKQVLSELISKRLSAGYSSDSKVDTLVNYIQKFPFLLSSDNVQNMVGFYFTKIFEEIFISGNLTKEGKYISKINNLILDSKLNKTNPDLVSNIYSQIASIYYRFHLYESQEEILKKAIELLPNSTKLASDLRIFQASKSELMDWARKNNVPTRAKPYSLDNESILVLKTIANRNRVNVNAKISTMLKKSKFTIESIVISNKIKKLPESEQLSFSFENDGIAFIIDEEGTRKGTWEYVNSSSTLKIFDSKDNEINYLEIYEFDGEVMKTVMYDDKEPIKIISILKRY